MIRTRQIGSARSDKCRGACRFVVAALLLLVAAPAWAQVAVDVTVSRNETNDRTVVTSPTFSTSAANELLLAFIATDSLPGPNTTVTNVTGAGLNWVLVVRSNVQRGTSEIWRAFAPARLTNVRVRATTSQNVLSSLIVMSFTGADASGTNGSGAIGAIASGNGPSGAPSAMLVTTRNNSLVLGVGNDPDNAIPRALGTGQTLINQYLTSVGNTYWLQRRTSHTPLSGTAVTINDTAPTTDRFNLSICEILAASAPQTWNISGTVSPAAAGSGTSLFIGGALVSTTADGAGNYNFAGMPNGTYTVTPSKSGYVFSPTSRSVIVNGASVTGVDFAAQPVATSFTVSGTITPASAGAGTLLTLGAQGTVVADSFGNYTFTNVPNGTYTLTPSKTGYVFAPASSAVTVNGANVTAVNFTAQPVATSFTVSGTITPTSAGAGTLLTLGAQGTVVADSFGNYTFTNVPNGTYTLTPSKTGFVFSPVSSSVTVNGANVTGLNFTAQAVPTSFTVSGTITPAAAGAGARLTLGAQGDVFADSFGNYTFANVPNGTHTLTPAKAGFGFFPTSKVVTINGASATGVNFTATSSGLWSSSFDLGLVAVNMVMMHTGKVLMYSGSYTASATERVWDPATGLLTLVPNPYYNLFCSGHSQLADGRILVVGGYDPNTLGAANANIFDPVSLSWTALPNMTYRRWYPSSTTLPDGRALISSGAQTCLTCLADVPEIFDPATGRFTTMLTARRAIPYYPFMFVLPDGKVVNAGANENTAATSTLDMTTKTWTTVDANVKDGHSAAMYEPGKILKSGTASDSGAFGSAAATAYVIDFTQPSPAWRQVASMAFPRAFHNTTLLPDGTVLVTGGSTALDGYDASKAVHEAELWSPETETWQTLARAALPRLYHGTALLLPDARVLIAGSGNDGPTLADQTRGEVFSPPYLFKGARPTITTAPATAQHGSTFTVQTPDAASIAKISLIRLGAITHSFDQDQRIVSLGFTAGVGSLSVQAPANANLAPPGYYMLFLVNTAGVPSVAKFVHLPPPGADSDPPSAPTGVTADGGLGSATVRWTASVDNTGVALYNIHRASTPGFQPSAANRVGQVTSTTFTNTGVAAGTHYYVVTAQDVAGNVSQSSGEVLVFVFADTTPPTVAITAPVDAITVTGSIVVLASASDDVGVASVQFKLDGNPLGAPRTAPPYSITWNSATTSNGPHTLTAMAADAAGNTSAAVVTVTVSNTLETPNGLVAAYGFNEAGGVLQVTDASGQGNTGTISGATRTLAGKFGGALSFNGTSAWVTVADAASLDLSTGMTIEAWVQPSSVTGWRTVVLKEAPNGLAYSLYSGNNALQPAGYVHPTADIGVNGTAAMVVNTWTHLAVTYDGQTLRMLVNGVEVNAEPAPGGTVTSDGILRIGGNAFWGEYFRGIIDEVRIYNRALTAAEVQTDMITPIP